MTQQLVVPEGPPVFAFCMITKGRYLGLPRRVLPLQPIAADGSVHEALLRSALQYGVVTIPGSQVIKFCGVSCDGRVCVGHYEIRPTDTWKASVRWLRRFDEMVYRLQVYEEDDRTVGAVRNCLLQFLVGR